MVAERTSSSAAESTRLYIQNLPIYVDQARLREHFESQGEVTDAVVIRTKDGSKSRRFGFVGYRSIEQARRARAYFHHSFFDTCKLAVTYAVQKSVDPKALGIRTWSKHTAPKPAKKAPEDEQVVKREEKKPKEHKTKEFEEFMESMTARSKSRFWANDDVTGTANALQEESESEVDVSDVVKDTVPEAKALKDKTPSSDMDFLRSKMTKHFDKAKGDETDRDGNAECEDKDSDIESEKEDVAELCVNRLFVRNVPFSATEDELKEVLESIGEVKDVHLPLDESKRRKGFGFVTFASNAEAQEAVEKADGLAFQGRVLHVSFATAKPQDDPLADASLSYKDRKELERKKSATEKIGWNASHIRSDATVGTLAERMGIARSDFLNQDQGNMAVRLAIGETMLIKENRAFFAEHGVDLNAIEGALVAKDNSSTQQRKVPRSTTVLLIKNLPHTTDEGELAHKFRKIGDIGRFLLAPSKTIALVEFLEPTEARKAFRALAYKKYQHVPIYLEWAPLQVFLDPSKAHKAKEEASKAGIVQSMDTLVANANNISEEAPKLELNNTLCVKNLSFSTVESGLQQVFENFGKLRKVTVARRKDAKRGMLSMGFGFVEYSDEKDAEKALQAFEVSPPILDGHALRISLSEKKAIAVGEKRPRNEHDDTVSRSKLIVRNVAFEANVDDIRKLFGAFGQLKRVRMPKKFDGRHRGFAFVDFLTAQEAESAFTALSKSHLYGRHLVLEWAEENSDQVEHGRAKACKDVSILKAFNEYGRRMDEQDEDDM